MHTPAEPGGREGGRGGPNISDTEDLKRAETNADSFGVNANGSFFSATESSIPVGL